MASLSYTSVLITGGNRGLGLNMIKHILHSSSVPKHIIATCRSLQAENAQELKKLAEKNSNLHVLEFDMVDVSGPRLSELVKQVSDIVQEAGLSLLINNAGMNIKQPFERITVDAMRSIYDINTIAPLMITRAFRPLLKRAADVKQPGDQCQATIVNISSILGSIEQTTSNMYLPYKISKTALNMITKSISCEFAGDGITIVSVHPGWVKTDMGGKNASLTIDESVSSVMKVISSLRKSHTGSFFSYDGTLIPW